MAVETISVGTELLLGQITDTNATYMSRRLAEIGQNVHYRTTVGDNQERIVACIRRALERADVVVLCGGLGPTSDDLTREAMAEACGRGMWRDPASEDAIRAIFEARRIPMAEMNLKQADVPDGAEAIPNSCGTAPGVSMEYEGKLLFAVPGVPSEMRAMMDQSVIPALVERGLAGVETIVSRVLRVMGLGESTCARLVQDLLLEQQNPTVAPLAGNGEVTLRITAKAASEAEARRMIASLESEIRARLGSYVYGADEENLEQVVVRTLIDHGLTLATAESCTGGLIGCRITDVSGSSECYLGGVVSYSNETKMELLGVDRLILEQYGAVSREVAEAMAVGVRRRLGADIGVSATGIAGPGGGSEGKPVGLVYIGLARDDDVSVTEHRFGQDRLGNKHRTSQAALDLIRRTLIGSSPP
ncbi:MAG: competence/damage-inducible protein A [Armatimonadetes bacterium]|jgi:nicotinamide-nucleotide amidase|nr:competence/damage-inducible protein A [Armatimonadota bacterium]MDI9602517.1 competence/damage-inducible protein A [Acidobacteriota bacterium]